MRMLFAAALVALPATAAVAQSPSNNVTCQIEIEGKRRDTGHCMVDIYGPPGGVYGNISWGAAHFAALSVQDDGSADGYWSGEEGGSHAHDPLGSLKLADGCWTNSRARLCFDGAVTLALSNEVDDEGVADDAKAPDGQQPADRDQASGGAPDLGSAFNELANLTTMSCLVSPREFVPASSPFFAQASQSNDLPKQKDFALDAKSRVTVNGKEVPSLLRQGSIIAVDVLSEFAAPAPLEDNIDPNSPQGGMRLYNGVSSQMARGMLEEMGIKNRVYVLDFDNTRAFVATLNGNQLTDKRPIQCE